MKEDSKRVPAIKLQGVCREFPPSIKAVCGVDLEIMKGEFVAVVGRSGSGKSTMLHLMGLMDKPTSGKIFFDGIETTQLEEEEVIQTRGKKIGFVFQAYNLFPELNAVENVAIAAMINGEKPNEAKEKAKKLLEAVGLGHRINQDITKISGGEKQRVAIARALINNPTIVLGDEPTGNLDTKSRDEIIELFKKLNKEGKTIVIVTHDMEVANKAKRIIKLEDGKIVKEIKN